MRSLFNRPFSRSCQLGELTFYRSSILKLRRPKKRATYRIFFRSFGNYERCYVWATACARTKKMVQGKMCFGRGIFFRTLRVRASENTLWRRGHRNILYDETSSASQQQTIHVHTVVNDTSPLRAHSILNFTIDRKK